MDWLRIIIMFMVFGMVGSILMDADHASYFVEHPNLIKQVTTPENYWETMKGVNGRALHIPLALLMSLIIIIAEVYNYEQNKTNRQ